jgi:hypothetical protein
VAIETTKPGVQKPHCDCRDGRSSPLHRVQLPSGPAMPSTVRTALPSQLRQEQDAGVQRAAPRRVGHHHRAGAAIALVAAFLGAGQAALFAQPVEQRDSSICACTPSTRCSKARCGSRNCPACARHAGMPAVAVTDTNNMFARWSFR